MMISRETATEIAYAHREIETAKKLLEEIQQARKWGAAPDVRDAFGRPQDGLQLGVPSGDNSRRLFNVPWSLCKPVIDAHIAQQNSKLAALSQKALSELEMRTAE